MFRNRLATTRSLGVVAAVALAGALLTGGPAHATPDDTAVKVDINVKVATGASSRPDLTAKSRAAGLTAAQADALQVKADRYLAKLGDSATQVAPDLIKLKGADLHLAVPGTTQLAPACSFYYFCAYSGEWFTGDSIHMYDCWEENFIPWVSFGSWKNNQTRGTQPLLEFTNGDLWWMPGAYAQQASGVGWSPVFSIVPCFH